MSNFEIGEIVLLQGLNYYPHLNGEETKILLFFQRNGEQWARIDMPHPDLPDFKMSQVPITRLRKRPDPKQAERIYEGLVKRLTKGVSA